MSEESPIEKYECPHCNGDGNEIDDNNSNGTIICYYCDGKRFVTFEEVEDYLSYDPNLM